MATNSFANTSWVSLEILRLLVNKLVVSEYFNRNWEKDFSKEFAPGSTIQIFSVWYPGAAIFKGSVTRRTPSLTACSQFF